MLEELEPRIALARVVVGEIGMVTTGQPVAEQHQTFQLQHNYKDPVVLTGPLSSNGSDPAMVRVVDVLQTGDDQGNGDSFTFVIDEWLYLDGWHTTETFTYIAVERGDYELEDGTRLAAGSLPMNLDLDLGQNWFPQTFQTPFDNAPVVFSQLSSENGPDPAVLQQRNIGPGGFQLKLREEEKRDNWHVTETVSWLAIEAGPGFNGTSNFLAGRTGNNVTDKFQTLTFGNDLGGNPAFTAPPALLATMQTTHGADTANVRYRNLGSSSVQLQIDEETSKDKETKHTTEDVGYLAWQLNDAGPTLLYRDIPEVALIVDTTEIAENSGTATFTLTRSGSTLDPLMVDLIMSELFSDAKLDEDFSIGGLNFSNDAGLRKAIAMIQAGQTSTNFTLTALDDELVEGYEQATLTLARSDAYFITSGTAGVAIRDDENLIGNGSFEQHEVSDPDGGETFPTIPSWVLENGTGFELFRGVLDGAAEADQFIELDGDGTQTAISQVAATEAGGIYQLRFAFKGRPGTSTNDNQLDLNILNIDPAGMETPTGFTLLDESTGQVVAVYDPTGQLIDPDGILDTDANNIPDALEVAGGGSWKYFSAVFFAAGEQTKIRFADIGIANGTGTFLDDVFLTEISTPAPESEPSGCDGGIHECVANEGAQAEAPVLRVDEHNGNPIQVFDALLKIGLPENPEEGDGGNGFFKASNGRWYNIIGTYHEVDGVMTLIDPDGVQLVVEAGQEAFNDLRTGEIRTKSVELKERLTNLVTETVTEARDLQAKGDTLTPEQLRTERRKFVDQSRHILQDLYGVTEGTDVLGKEEREALGVVIDVQTELSGALAEIDANDDPEMTEEERQEIFDLAWNMSHISIDVAGIFDPSPTADSISMGMSAINQDWWGVGISTISFLPYGGDLAKAGKFGKWGETLVHLVDIAADASKSRFATVMDPVMEVGKRAVDKIPFRHLPSNFSSGLGTKFDDIGRYLARRQVDPFCFKSDTLVSTANGPKPIGNVEAGEQVHAFDFTAGEWTLAEVVQRHDNIVNGAMVTIGVGNDVIEATSNHPFWIVDGEGLANRPQAREIARGEDEGQSLTGRWVNSQHLQAGDVVVGRDGAQRRIASVEVENAEDVAVSNLTLKVHHSFSVGRHGVLVHNRGSWCGVLEEIPGETGDAWKATKNALQDAHPGSGIHGHHIVQNIVPKQWNTVTRAGDDGVKRYIREFDELPADLSEWTKRDLSAWYIGKSHEIMGANGVKTFTAAEHGTTAAAEAAARAADPDELLNLTMAVNGKGVHKMETHRAVYEALSEAENAAELKTVLQSISEKFAKDGTFLDPF